MLSSHEELRLTFPHFLRDRPGVTVLLIELLHDVVVARLVAVLAQLENILDLSHFDLETSEAITRAQQ